MQYRQLSESFVCDGFTPVRLRYPRGVKDVNVYAVADNTRCEYEEGRDYTVTGGCIVRTHGSRFPDFSQSVFYGKNPFDHELYAEWGNADYMLYADYTAEVDPQELTENIAVAQAKANGQYGALAAFLNRFRNKPLRICVFGDSISTGAEATEIGKAYFYGFAREIDAKYNTESEVLMHAIGGESSESGRARYRDVLRDKADLMLLAYGMNDQNLHDGRFATPPERYAENIQLITGEVSAAGTQAVLISPCSPHPHWIHTSGKTDEYVAVLSELSKSLHVPFADVYSLWQEELRYKSDDDLLHNGINHPSDYGHAIYAIALKCLL